MNPVGSRHLGALTADNGASMPVRALTGMAFMAEAAHANLAKRDTLALLTNKLIRIA